MRTRMVAGMAGLVAAGNLLTGSQGIAATGQMIGQIGGQLLGYNSQAASIQVIDEEAEVIPSDAVRLRIIANSDSPQDQALKRKVRDRIIQEVGVRLRGVTDHNDARQVLQSVLPELNNIAAETVKKEGYKYQVSTDYGKVPFPTKIYGSNVYPAGEYEALRIVIGEGQGQNWWCVLFPPLCFVDVANGDAIQPKDMGTKPVATLQVPTGDNKTTQTVQVRFGILDAIMGLVTKLSDFFTRLFG